MFKKSIFVLSILIAGLFLIDPVFADNHQSQNECTTSKDGTDGTTGKNGGDGNDGKDGDNLFKTIKCFFQG